MNYNRKSLIETLINTSFGGNQAAFGRAIGKSPGQVNQWLTGYRSVGDGVARHIEMVLDLGNGWMDGKASQLKQKPVTREATPIDTVLADLAALEPEDADVWRAEIRRAAIKARKEKQERDQERAARSTDPPLERRHTA